METEFFGETEDIEGVDTLIDEVYPSEETEDANDYKGSDRSALTSWLRSVAGHRLLTREEEVELAKRIEAGYSSARRVGSGKFASRHFYRCQVPRKQGPA